VQALLDRLNGPLHLGLALAVAWLILGSPWIGMYQQMPEEADWINTSHVVLGFAALAMGVVYTAGCMQGGRWRQYLPWLGGDLAAVGGDLTGLLRGRLPTVEGGGLLALIEGLLLLATLAAGLSGAAWFVVQGAEAAVAWREVHIVAARSCAALVLLHVLGVALHLLDFVRD
jgi:hypothetical protein